MINRRLPVRPRQRSTLRIRNREDRHISKLVVKRSEVRDIEPAVQGCDVRNPQESRDWKMQVIDVEMDHIEFARALRYLLQQHDVVRNLIHAAFIQSKRAAAYGNKPGCGHRIATCEKGDFVPLADQFLTKIRNDSFGPSILLWRHTLDERRYLSDSHTSPFFPCAMPALLPAAVAKCAFVPRDWRRNVSFPLTALDFLCFDPNRVFGWFQRATRAICIDLGEFSAEEQDLR